MTDCNTKNADPTLTEMEMVWADIDRLRKRRIPHADQKNSV